jgi:hypothetical protein
MAQTIAIAVLAAVYFLIRYLNRTDIPKIKGLPEIPGVPVFGNLLQLGDRHATVAAKWAKKYGPVFQVRMGNKVSPLMTLFTFCWVGSLLTDSSASYLPTASNQ